MGTLGVFETMDVLGTLGMEGSLRAMKKGELWGPRILWVTVVENHRDLGEIQYVFTPK